MYDADGYEFAIEGTSVQLHFDLACQLQIADEKRGD